MEQIAISTELKQLINADLAHNYKVIPKEKTEDSFHFYCSESVLNDSLKNEFELIFGKKIVLHATPETIINKALVTFYRRSQNQSNAAASENFQLNNKDFLEKLIFEAKAIGSSDIHFEIFKNEGRIRYRIDGKLIEKYKIEKDNYAELVNKVKIKANLDITEKRLPQDGRINYSEFDMRVSILPTLHGEKIVMRILSRDTAHLSIDKLGMSDEEKQVYLESLKATKGIILISGPTGSGKTTTLYASLKMLNKISSNIVTVEDPIEYTLKGINQVQLKEDIGLTFTSALRSFLRQDPDIIMLGEIRDATTAEMAIRASLTGHLVLSTIHTNSAIGTISRLVDMGIPPFLIAETLQISVAQRLVRKLCNSCKTEIDFDHSKNTSTALNAIETHYVPNGCDDCYYTGYKGRTAIYEIIPITTDLIQEIKKNSTHLEESVSGYSKNNLSSKAIDLVKQGITSVEEVYSIIVTT